MQILAFFTARVNDEKMEAPTPDDILRVLERSVSSWTTEGQARARLKVCSARGTACLGTSFA